MRFFGIRIFKKKVLKENYLMNKKQKIFLVAFGTNDLKRSIKRLQLQAQNSKFYDDIKIFDDQFFACTIKICLPFVHIRSLPKSLLPFSMP